MREASEKDNRDQEDDEKVSDRQGDNQECLLEGVSVMVLSTFFGDCRVFTREEDEEEKHTANDQLPSSLQVVQESPHQEETTPLYSNLGDSQKSSTAGEAIDFIAATNVFTTPR